MTFRALAAAGLAAIALAGCGEDGLGDAPGGATTTREADTAQPKPTPKPEKKRTPRLRPARCPAAAANCAAAVGTVLYIESVDPDGDGDLHVVATRTSGDAVTGAGLVVFDVSKDIRPRRDPRVGQTVTGRGPVFQGSHGQRQIQVEEFRVAR